MPFDTPFKMGPFDVDARGRLSPSVGEAAPAFLFRWRGRTIRARLVQVDPEGGQLMLQTTLGRVPSTASTPDGTLRPHSFALLHWLPRSVPPDWRLCLLADHRVVLEADPRISLPATAAALLTELTCFLLALAPYIDLLDEAGVIGPATSPPVTNA